jgi:hypothetical protein
MWPRLQLAIVISSAAILVAALWIYGVPVLQLDKCQEPVPRLWLQ